MSEGDRLRKVILEGVRDGWVTLKIAALRLDVTFLQLRRIWKRFRDEGEIRAWSIGAADAPAPGVAEPTDKRGPTWPGRSKPPRVPKTPRVVELLRKAIEWKALLESGQIATKADIACQEGITRAQVTQVMGMLRLAPEIQQQILSMPEIARRPPVTERSLRPVRAINDRHYQLREFQKLLG